MRLDKKSLALKFSIEYQNLVHNAIYAFNFIKINIFGTAPDFDIK